MPADAAEFRNRSQALSVSSDGRRFIFVGEIDMKKLLATGAFAVLLGAGGVATTATPASAYIACNRHGDCWHTSRRYRYRPSFGIVIHGDNLRWDRRHRHHYRWREHSGRGYWHNGLWVTF
jgi:hypothetical protein